VTRTGLLGPAQPHGPSWTQPKKINKKIIINSKNIFKKLFVIFSYILLHFDQYWFVFLYYKDTNPVLKYLVFIKKYKNKMFCFRAYGEVSQK